MNPAIKSYILYESPLKTQKGKISLICVLLLVFAFAVAGRVNTDFHELLSAYAWMSYSIVGSLATFFIVTFFNRKRAIRWFHLLTVLFVALQTAFVAKFLNDISPFKFYTVGYIEEFVKILPALLIFIYLPNLIRTKKDGMVFGALGGIGFNIIEIALYITKGIMSGEKTWTQAIYAHSTRLAILGFGNHVIWSAFIGLGLGMVAESSKKGLRKWLPFILIYLLVSTIHSLFDLFLAGIFLVLSLIVLNLVTGKGVNIEAENVSLDEPGPLRTSAIIEHFAYNVIFIIIIIRQLFKSAKFEQELNIHQLQDEPPHVITEDEKSILRSEGRFGFRRYPALPKDLSKKIVKLQNLVAMQKHVLCSEKKSQTDSEELRSLREEILSLRTVASVADNYQPVRL